MKFAFIPWLVLSAALAHAEQPLSATLSRRDLLAAAFPEWRPARDLTGKPAATFIDAIAMPQVAWPWLPHAPNADGATTVHVVPLNVTRLDETHAVLVTWALPVASDAACDSYFCTYALGAYFFTRSGDAWRLSHRVDVAANPYGSTAPKARVERWAERGFVIGTTQQHQHGGYEVEHVALLGLAPDQLMFSFQTNISKDDNAAHDYDCNGILDPSYVPPVDGLPPVRCEEADGKWRVEGDSIRIDFAERSRATDETGRLLPPVRKNFFARLQPSSGTLSLVDGRLGDYGL